MGIRITGNQFIEGNIERAQKDSSTSLERLSSGVVFTRDDPMPADRARSDSLTTKIRNFSSYKRNASDGLSLMEFADSGLSELSNINIRMQELVTQSTNPSISDKERQFLFVEYQSLYDEFDRQALTANFNGQTLLDHKSGDRTEIDFRVGSTKEDDKKDVNLIRLENLDEVKARPRDLGLVSAKDLLDQDNGVSIDDMLDTFDADSVDELGKTFDKANEKMMGYRAKFGATTTRLNHAIASIDVASENISAVNSRVRDVDYATEVTNLTQANILLQASTSLLTQRQQLQSQSVLSLIRGAS
ncbi:MAG: flagellin [Bdellovibrionota bacterium]